MKTPHIIAAGALALLLSPATHAQGQEATDVPALNPAAVAKEPFLPDWLTLGADIRARYETFDNLPANGPLGDRWSYFRFRSRAFAKIDAGDFTFHTRAVNEWRKLDNGRGRNSYPFADQLVLDLLYAEYRAKISDTPFRTRLGRQEIMDLGSLRVLGEGTAGDGSRTFTFNAARFTLTPVEKLNLDVIGIYNRWYDELAIGGLDGDIVRDRKRDLNGNRSDESGAVLYLADKRNADFAYEGYYIWKHETKDARGTIPGKTNGNIGRDTHTLGTRLLPKFTDTLSGEFEAAGQLGKTEDHRNIYAFMLHGGITQNLEPVKGFTPYVTGAATMFSGDKNEGDNSSVTAWNPVWGRLPHYGDLSGMQYPGMSFWYQNLIYPHAEIGFFNEKKTHSLRFQTGPMFAQCKNGSDVAANQASDSHYRGWHFFSQYAFPLYANKDGILKDLSALVEADCILPGDYFEQSSAIYFLRFQLLAKF